MHHTTLNIMHSTADKNLIQQMHSTYALYIMHYALFNLLINILCIMHYILCIIYASGATLCKYAKPDSTNAFNIQHARTDFVDKICCEHLKRANNISLIYLLTGRSVVCIS